MYYSVSIWMINEPSLLQRTARRIYCSDMLPLDPEMEQIRHREKQRASLLHVHFMHFAQRTNGFSTNKVISIDKNSRIWHKQGGVQCGWNYKSWNKLHWQVYNPCKIKLRGVVAIICLNKKPYDAENHLTLVYITKTVDHNSVKIFNSRHCRCTQSWTFTRQFSEMQNIFLKNNFETPSFVYSEWTLQILKS